MENNIIYLAEHREKQTKEIDFKDKLNNVLKDYKQSELLTALKNKALGDKSPEFKRGFANAIEYVKLIEEKS